MSRDAFFIRDPRGIKNILNGLEVRNTIKSVANKIGNSTGIPGRVDVQTGKHRAIARYTTGELTPQEKRRFHDSLRGYTSGRGK